MIIGCGVTGGVLFAGCGRESNVEQKAVSFNTYTWTISSIATITLNANGGSGGASKIYNVNCSQMSYGKPGGLQQVWPADRYWLNTNGTSSIDPFASPISKPTRSGYSFLGYYTSASGGTQVIDSSGNITASVSTYTSNATWYAHWQFKTPAVPSRTQFYAYGNDGTVSPPRGYNVNSISLTYYGYGFKTNSAGYLESQNKGVASSYSMVKIRFNASASGIFTIKYISSGESSYDYAIFSNLDSALQANNMEDTSYFKSAKGEPSTAEKSVTYSVSSGWHDIYVKYRKDGSVDNGNDSVQLFFETDWSGSGNSSSTYQFVGMKYGTLPTATRTGYTFGGWWTASSGGTQITSNSIYNGEHIYAHWNANVVKINLNANGGSGGATAIWFKYGTNTMYSNSACTSSITSISLPSRTGYTFNNYYCASATQGANTNESYIYSGGNWGADLCTDFYSEATLTASWTIKSYTLSVINGDDGIDDITNPATAWNIGGGRYVAGGGKSISVNYNQTVTIAVAVKQGYTFSRWSDGNTSMSRTVTIGTSNATYYAYTTPNTYNVTLNANGGSVEIPMSEWTLEGGATYDASTGALYLPNANSKVLSPLIYVGDTEVNSTYKWGFTADFMCPTSATSSSGNMFLGGGGYYNASKSKYSGNGWARRASVGVWTKRDAIFADLQNYLGQDNCQYIQIDFSRSTEWANDPYYVKNVHFWVDDSKSEEKSAKNVNFNTTYGTLPTPTRANYTFDGWWTKKNCLDMDDFMRFFNEQEDLLDVDGKQYMTRDTQGVYSWGGATSGYWKDGSFIKHKYFPNLVVGAKYRLSFFAKNTRSDNLTTTTIYHAGSYEDLPKEHPENPYTWDSVNSNIWKKYESCFKVTGSNFWLDLGYNYGDLTYFKDIRLERIDVDDYETQISSTSTYNFVGDSYLYAKWMPITITNNVCLRVINKDGSYTNVDNAAGGSVRVERYTVNGTTSSSTNSTQTSGTSSYVVHQGQQFKLTATPNQGYVFAGFSTSSSASASNKMPSSSLSKTATYTPTSGTSYYVYFKQVSPNQLKYDESDKYFYFEDGFYPQSEVNTAVKMQMSSSDSSLNASYDNKTSIMTLNGVATGYVMLCAEDMTFKKGQKYELSIELLSGTVECENNNWVFVLEVSTDTTGWYGSGLSSNRNFCETRAGTCSFEVSQVGEDLGKYLTFWIYRAGTLTFNNAKYKLTISPKFDDWLNTSATANGEKFTYNNGSQNVDIPVYTFNNEKYVKVTKGSESKWFKFEPIRWRISDYGVEKTETNYIKYEALRKYTGYATNFTAVSDLILGVGAMHNTREVREGTSVTSMKGFQLVEETTDGCSITFQYAKSGNVIKVDNYSTSTQNNAVSTGTTAYSAPMRIASLEEITSLGLVNKGARASDMVAFILGQDKNNVTYWTRDLSNLGSGVAITSTGTKVQTWLNQLQGMRFAYTFSEGSNVGGGTLINIGGQNADVIEHGSNCETVSYDTKTNVYTITTTATNRDPNFVIANHYVDLVEGETYYVTADVKKASGGDAEISIFLGTGPWNGEIQSLILKGEGSIRYFTAPKTGRFYLDLENEGEYGHTGGAIIKVSNLRFFKV